jgi:hypothetical protein
VAHHVPAKIGLAMEDSILHPKKNKKIHPPISECIFDQNIKEFGYSIQRSMIRQHLVLVRHVLEHEQVSQSMCCHRM